MKQLPPLKSLIFISLLVVLFIALLVRIEWNQYNQTFSQSLTKKTTSDTGETNTVPFIPLFEADPILGDQTTPIRIVTFEDFLCPNCKLQQQFLRQLIEEFPDTVHIIWKDTPIVTLPYDSTLVHMYGYCANEQQRFAEFHERATNIIIPTESLLSEIASDIGVNQNRLTTCLQSTRPLDHFEKNKLVATALNIQSVPIFFINDKQIPTPQSYVAWTQLIEQYK